MLNEIYSIFSTFGVENPKNVFQSIILTKIKDIRENLRAVDLEQDNHLASRYLLQFSDIQEILEQKLGFRRKEIAGSIAFYEQLLDSNIPNSDYKSDIIREYIQLKNELLNSLLPREFIQNVSTPDGVSKLLELEKPSFFHLQKAIEKEAIEINGKWNERRDNKKDNSRKEKATKSVSKPLTEFYKSENNLVLIGDPGAGKSWSLALYFNELHKSISIPVSVDKKYKRISPAWIPVILTVNEVKPIRENIKLNIGKKNQTYYAELLSKIGASHLKSLGWEEAELISHLLLKIGFFTFIFDGLNEIQSDERKEFAKTLKGCIQNFPLNRYILSSRSYHWVDDQEYFGFWGKVLRIEGLSDPKVKKFIDKYFENEAEEIGERLKEKLFDGTIPESVKDLRKNPFFLDKLIGIFKITKTFPTTRGDLFKDYIELYKEYPDWWNLQNWMLKILGMHMTFLNKTFIPELEVISILSKAFCIAPSKYFYDGKNCLLDSNIKISNLNFLGPEELIPDNSELGFLDRFEGEVGIVRKAFFEVYDLIIKNKNVQVSGGIGTFMHQSFQEYFAADRFADLYEKNPQGIIKFLRDKRFDEMFHIVVGCIFKDRKDSIYDIIETLILKGFHLEFAFDCILKAEWIETKSEKVLVEICQKQYLEKGNMPDEARALALKIIHYLDEKNECFLFKHLQKNPFPNEQRKLWATILDLNYEIRGSTLSFIQTLEKVLEQRSFQDKTVTNTASWIRRHWNSDNALHNVIVKLLEKSAIDNSVVNESVVALLWDIWKEKPFGFDFYWWKKIFLRIQKGKLLKSFLWLGTHFDEYDKFYRLVFNLENFDKIIDKVENLNDDYEETIYLLFDKAIKYELLSEEILHRFNTIFEAKKYYPKSLFYNFHRIPSDLIFKYQLDKKLFDYFESTWPNVPFASGKDPILKFIENEESSSIAILSRNLPTLALHTFTGYNGSSKNFIEIATHIVRACEKSGIHDYWFRDFLRILYTNDLNLFKKQIEKRVFIEQRKAIAMRAFIFGEKYELDDDFFINSFDKNPDSAGLLIFLGMNSDRFIYKRPDLISRGVNSILRYYNNLDISQFHYSTRLIMYLQTREQTFPFPFPGNVPPTWDKESFSLFLKYGHYIEASHMLVAITKTSWEKEFNELRGLYNGKSLKTLENAIEHLRKAEWFSPNTEKEAADLHTKKGLEDIGKLKTELKENQFRSLLSLIKSENKLLFIDRINVLKRSKFWKNSNEKLDQYKEEFFKEFLEVDSTIEITNEKELEDLFASIGLNNIQKIIEVLFSPINNSRTFGKRESLLISVISRYIELWKKSPESISKLPRFNIAFSSIINLSYGAYSTGQRKKIAEVVYLLYEHLEHGYKIKNKVLNFEEIITKKLEENISKNGKSQKTELDYNFKETIWEITKIFEEKTNKRLFIPTELFGIS